MLIADHREIQIVYNTGRHRPWRPVCRTTHGPRLSSQVCCTGLTIVEHVIEFSIFDPGGLPLSQISLKGEMIYCQPRSAILQNFSPIMQTIYEICITKVSFHFFGLGANPWAKVYQEGRRFGSLLDIPLCKISSPYVNPRPRYPLPCYQSPANKQKKPKKSNRYIPPCLLACGDKKAHI